MKPERRYVDFELRDGGEDETPKIVGHAAVFNQVTDIGGYFNEQISPGAFRSAIDDADVMALFNHDSNYVLGRTGAGTLTLREDETGLYTEIVPPDAQWARDLMASIKRGDIRKMSFAFTSGVEEWDNDANLRTIKTVEKLYDVSPVTYPAYRGTDVGVRSAQEIFEGFREQKESGGGAEVLALRLRELELFAKFK